MKPPGNTHIYECDVQTFWFDENGILCAVSKDMPRTLDKQQKAYELVKQISGNKKVCYLTEVTYIQPPDRETREYVLKESQNLFKAVAVISNSVLGRMIANILFRMKSQPYPTKMFSDENEAKDWLKQYLHDGSNNSTVSRRPSSLKIF